MPQERLPFNFVITERPDYVTGHAGVPFIIEYFRMLISRRYYKDLARVLYFRSWKTVRLRLESLIVLIISGGTSLDDLNMLRGDDGLCLLLGGKPSSPSQAKDFLYRFQQDKSGQVLPKEADFELSVMGRAVIREEGPGLMALNGILQELNRKIQAVRPSHRATLDVDATIIEAYKKTSLKTYEGTYGYQPQMAYWAEKGIYLCDEFRDGNVPAAFKVKEFLEKTFAALPGSVTERRLRADSALFCNDAIRWLADRNILFCISADMTQSLRKTVLEIPDDQWRPYTTINNDPNANQEERYCAEVNFVPDSFLNHKKKGNPLRYIAIKVRSKQRDMYLDDKERWRYFAVVTNMNWDAERLLRWHREKQGTIEHAHGYLKNDLAAGTLPCSRFSSNAAWLRINIIVFNLTAFIKEVLLPQQMQYCRPKTLRFRIINIAGRVTRHARQTILKISKNIPTAHILQSMRSNLDLIALKVAYAPPG